MRILGVADGHDAGAALVVDHQVIATSLEAHHDRSPRSRAFPWSAIDAVLAAGGVDPSELDLVAMAGRYTPPFFVRRHPGVHGFTQDPFSPLHSANVFWQRMLRSSGLGALEADRAGDWLLKRFRERGFEPRRMVLVDVHRALAAAAYRCQPHDRALVITLHPRGDGLAVAVHEGYGGQLDLVHRQADLGTLHVHLRRAAVALGFDPVAGGRRLWGHAARGRPIDGVVQALQPELRLRGIQLESRSTASDGPDDPPWGDLKAVARADAAASVLAHLHKVLLPFVSALVARFGRRTGGVVAVGGSMLDNPRLLADLAGLESVGMVEAGPIGGHASLALGAALDQAGSAPRRVLASEIGLRPASPPAGPRALGTPEVVAMLAERRAVARLRRAAAGAEHGLGAASILVRADEPDTIELVRRRLGLWDEAEPALVAMAGTFEAAHGARLAGPLAQGLAAPVIRGAPPRCGGALTADGRAHLVTLGDDSEDAELVALLRRLRAEAGAPAVACWPLTVDHQPPGASAEAALDASRRAGAAAIQIGTTWAELG